MTRRALGLLLLCTAFTAPLAATRQPVRARHGMVVAMESIATDVGVGVLQKGGNAVDAAVAVGFALAVTHPYAGNIGGGGYMLIRMADGRTTFIDFRERAPQASTRNMYLDAQGNLTRDSIEGWRSSGVPGSVRGFEIANTKYGTRKWAENMAPAIDLAMKGYPVSYPLSESLKDSRSLGRDPESRRIFQRDGRFFEMADTLLQPELGRTLQRIAANGPNEFYEGDTARRFAEEMAKHGGLITQADLKNYKAIERTPLQGTYKGYTVITAPPSSSGGIALLEMLGILDGTGYEKSGAGSASAIHYQAEAMRRAYADRNEYIGDPEFVQNPIAGLLDKAYLSKLRATIDPVHATPSAAVKPGQPAGTEKTETTHYSVVDAQGNAVAVTYTLNGGYGNGITVPGLGFLLNNEMDDFTSKPGSANMFGLVQGERNVIAPGKRPLSSMTPTILLKDGKLFMTVGAPGGSRISTAVLQVILNVVDFGMNVQDAIDAPRVHHQWMPDRLSLERAISPDTVDLLKSRGYDVDYNAGVVLAQTAAIVSDGGWLQGGSDGRSAAGKAAGY
ncbi:MAG TPA: gamma-glutamyltransferase [Vicinamibacterales bacterium]|nr:gamma-glutamyltransferase [Vicinamibacterales bacterium]